MIGYNIVVINQFKYYISLVIRLLALKNIYVPSKQYYTVFTDEFNEHFQQSNDFIRTKYKVPLFKNGIMSMFTKYCYFHHAISKFKTLIIYPSCINDANNTLGDIFKTIHGVNLNVIDPDFIKWCIKYYYNRDAFPEEIQHHIQQNKQTNISLVTWLFSLYICPEGKDIGLQHVLDLEVYDNKKIAVTFCGHVRDLNTVYKTHNKIIFHPNFDVFIHTWNDSGIKCKQQWFKHWMSPDQVIITKEQVDNIYHCVDMIIEDNKSILETMSLIGKINPIFLFESQARDDASKYINSQLYSIYKAFNLVEKHMKFTGIEYVGLIKLRFDMKISHFNIPKIFDDMKNNTVYFPHGCCNMHKHFAGGGGCLTCDSECDIKFHDKHTNDICDIWFYTNKNLMEYTCSMYNYSLGILQKNHKRNIELLSSLSHEMIDQFVYIHGDAIEREIVCFYPERMLREHLNAFHCKSSKHIQGNINDSSR